MGVVARFGSIEAIIWVLSVICSTSKSRLYRTIGTGVNWAAGDGPDCTSLSAGVESLGEG